MATYIYKAKKNTAETVDGEIKAHSQDEAIELINQLGLLPISVQMQDSDKKYRGAKYSMKLASRERYIFTKQLELCMVADMVLLRLLLVVFYQLL